MLVYYCSTQKLYYMIESFPNVLVSDVYGSAGGVTVYHRDGQVCLRRRSRARYPGTAAQLEHLAVHRRALAAWRGLSHDVQEVWNGYAQEVEPHRPPFDGKAWISGQNLFVSAYHGFCTLGDEHVPVACRFEGVPVAAVVGVVAVEEGDELELRFEVAGLHGADGSRYRMYGQVQVSDYGFGTSSKLKWRSVLAEGDCCSMPVVMRVPQWREVWRNVGCARRFSLHVRFVLIDSVTGYRGQRFRGSFEVVF